LLCVCSETRRGHVDLTCLKQLQISPKALLSLPLLERLTPRLPMTKEPLCSSSVALAVEEQRFRNSEELIGRTTLARSRLSKVGAETSLEFEGQPD